MKRLLLAMLACAGFSSAATADDNITQPALRQAFDAAKSGNLTPVRLASFARDPLYGWLQALAVQQDLANAEPRRVDALLASLKGQPAGDWLREAWLAELARREAWPDFLRLYAGSEKRELRCAGLAGRLATGRVDDAWIRDTQAIWLTGTSLPDACNPAIEALSARGLMDQALRWQRFDLAIDDAQTGLMRHLAKSFAVADAPLANDYADFIDSPHARAAQWPRDARSRSVATIGLARLAKRDPSGAEARLAEIAPVLGLDEAQRGKVLADIALWTVASYGEGAVRRFANVPESAYDERLHEWRVREAMARSDDAAALVGIEKMPAPQRNDSRWQYFEARLRERQGQKADARSAYLRAAASPSFHGWLAADRLQQTYALCPLEPAKDAALRAKIDGHAGLNRAFALFSLEQPAFAMLEWNAAVAGMADAERKLAITAAQKHHWYDRGVFSIGGAPADLRHYSLRFPLPYAETLRRQAQLNGLDAAWVAAQTRAESIFMPTVTSAADARGLMQVLPSTGEAMAKRLGREWRGAHSLYEPDTNLTLGTAYLRQLLDRYQGLPYLAIAAYNAGPAPIARWQDARAALEPDFWIETIPYKETRDYVARVLAFSVVYDWRLNGSALPLSDRLLGRFDGKAARRTFTCPAPAVGTATGH